VKTERIAGNATSSWVTRVGAVAVVIVLGTSSLECGWQKSDRQLPSPGARAPTVDRDPCAVRPQVHPFAAEGAPNGHRVSPSPLVRNDHSRRPVVDRDPTARPVIGAAADGTLLNARQSGCLLATGHAARLTVAVTFPEGTPCFN
jgi:hypothetical protein